MVTTALVAIALAAAQGSGPPVQPRKAYGACLNQFVQKALKDKVEVPAFKGAAKAACAKEEAAFRASLIAFDIKMKIKRVEAEENAAMQVEDYLANSADSYEGQLADSGSPQ